MTMTPDAVIRDFVSGHEGGYQNKLEDRGNIVIDRNGKIIPGPKQAFNLAARRKAMAEGGRVIGTMRGVTPATYAQFQGRSVYSLDEQQMQAISEDEAVEVGLKLYYVAPGIDQLPWGPITAILVDMGWGSGPETAIKFIQRRIRCSADGVVGPEMIDAWNKWIETQGVAKAATDFANWKIAAYQADVAKNPEQRKWLQGWINRANYFKPENWAWWKKWEEDTEVIRNASGDLLEYRNDDGAQRRLDVNASPAISGARSGIWATIGSAVAGLGYMASSIVKDIANIFPQWMWGALGLVAAIFALLYFTGLIKLRRQEHKDWKH